MGSDTERLLCAQALPKGLQTHTSLQASFPIVLCEDKCGRRESRKNC